MGHLREYMQSKEMGGGMRRSVNAMLAGINRFFAFMGWPECKVKAQRVQRRRLRQAERGLDPEE